MSQMNPVDALSCCCFNIDIQAVLLGTSRPSKWSLSLSLSHRNPISIFMFPHACHMSYPFHPLWFDQPNNIWWVVELVKELIMQFSSSFRVLPPFLSSNIFQHLRFSRQSAHESVNIVNRTNRPSLHSGGTMAWWQEYTKHGQRILRFSEGQIIIVVYILRISGPFTLSVIQL